MGYKLKLKDESSSLKTYEELLNKAIEEEKKTYPSYQPEKNKENFEKRKEILKTTANKEILKLAYEKEPIALFVNYFSDWTAFYMLYNPNCPEELLLRFLDRYYGDLRVEDRVEELVFNHPNFSDELLIKIANKDPEFAKNHSWVSWRSSLAKEMLKAKGIKIKQERIKTNIDISDFKITDYYTDGQQAGIEVHAEFILNGREGDIQVIGEIDEDQSDLDDEMAEAYAEETGLDSFDIREELNNSHFDWSGIKGDIQLSLDGFLDKDEKLSKKDYNYLVNEFLKGIKSYINEELSYDKALVNKIESSFDEDMNYIEDSKFRDSDYDVMIDDLRFDTKQFLNKLFYKIPEIKVTKIPNEYYIIEFSLPGDSVYSKVTLTDLKRELKKKYGFSKVSSSRFSNPRLTQGYIEYTIYCYLNENNYGGK